MTPAQPPLVVFLVDAFRHDFLSHDVTPSLAALANAGVRRPLQPILGYSDAIRATAFTGRYPDETGYWMEYCFRPESSPWKGVARAAGLDRFPSERAVRALKFGASAVATRTLAARRGLPHLSLRNIPLRGLDRFDLTLRQAMTEPMALGFPSIFDTCTSTGRPWAYLDASTVRRGRDLLDQLETVPEDVGLIFVYLHQVDMAAHLFGIDSRVFWARVRSTDALVGALLAQARARFGPIETVVFSDHGMSELRRQVSLQDLLEHPGFPDRFFCAFDATMVRLWFHDDDAALREEVLDRVASRLPGRFLTDADRARYHLRFADRLYGDEIFLLPAGTAVFPNFHSYVKPRAMHAYAPEDQDQWGIYIGPQATASSVSHPVDLTEVTAVISEGLLRGCTP